MLCTHHRNESKKNIIHYLYDFFKKISFFSLGAASCVVLWKNSLFTLHVAVLLETYFSIQEGVSGCHQMVLTSVESLGSR